MAEKNKVGLVITSLVLIIVILLGFIGYLYLFKPALANYAVQKQTEGFQYAILSIMQQAAQCQPVPLYFENQSVNVVAVECLQQAQQ